MCVSTGSTMGDVALGFATGGLSTVAQAGTGQLHSQQKDLKIPTTQTPAAAPVSAPLPKPAGFKVDGGYSSDPGVGLQIR